MAQQTHNPTRSNNPQATSVSPLGHESSPQNDFSESALIKALDALLSFAKSHKLGDERDLLEFRLRMFGMKNRDALIDLELKKDDNTRLVQEKITAIARYCDEAEELIELGVNLSLMMKNEEKKNEK